VRITILTQFYPPEFGAAAVRLSRLARLLAADGHQVTVLTGMPNYPEGVIHSAYRGKVFSQETLDGVDVRRVWVSASPSKRARARLLNQFSFLLMAALRGTFLARPDVFLVESHPLPIVLAAGWLKRIKRAPIVLNVSDLWPESAVATGALSADSQMVKIASKIEKWAYHDAAQIVSMTQGVHEGILHVHPHPHRVTLIQNAVDLERFKPGDAALRCEIREKYGIGDRFMAVHVGNMSLTYDFDILLETAAALPDMAFLFAGGGSQEADIRQNAADRGLQNVIFAGVLPHADMPGIWAAADASLIALRDHSVAGGTLPAKMYESLATGTPIVAAIRGEGAALIEQAGAGLIVPIGDANAYTAALQHLASSPALCERLRVDARTYAEKYLSPDQVKARYLEQFEQAYNER